MTNQKIKAVVLYFFTFETLSAVDYYKTDRKTSKQFASKTHKSEDFISDFIVDFAMNSATIITSPTTGSAFYKHNKLFLPDELSRAETRAVFKRLSSELREVRVVELPSTW